MAFKGINLETDKQNASLFKITRNKDANEIFYNVKKLANGKLNGQEPIDVFWIKHVDSVRKEPLTYIQKKYAYGLSFISITDYEAKFKFVSYDKRSFTLKKNKAGTYRVFTVSQNREVEVSKIFLHIHGGSFWFPKITAVELHGTDAATGASIKEIIQP